MPRMTHNTSAISTRSNASRASRKANNTTSNNTSSSSNDATSSTSNTSGSPEPQPRRTRMTKKERQDMILRMSGKFLIPRRSFARVVKEVTQTHNADIRFQSIALTALQDATEQFITGIFQAAHICTLHRQRATLTQKDMALVQRLTELLNLNSC